MDRDLHRAAAAKSEAIWLLSNKFSDRPDEEDGLTVLRSLQLNTFVRRDAKRRLERNMGGLAPTEYEGGGTSSWRQRRRSSNSSQRAEAKIFTQLIQPENRNKLDITRSDVDTVAGGGADHARNVLCIDEMKMHIIARSCVVGFFLGGGVPRYFVSRTTLTLCRPRASSRC